MPRNPSRSARPVPSSSRRNPPPPVVAWPDEEPQSVRSSLLEWHAGRGRHDLPWITTESTPNRDYRVTLSEIMLQQTTVSTGLKRYPKWLEQFPTWSSLASASIDEVMKAWEGLGYYARARSLHTMAKMIVAEHGGVVPLDRSDRLALPGVGPSTASALGSFIYGAREPIWDANVNRIWRRWWGDRWPSGLTPSQNRAWIWEMARDAMPSDGRGIEDWTQAVMDLGATVCTARNPNCSACPWQRTCRAYKLGQPEMFGASTVTKKVKEIQLNWLLVRDDVGRVAVCSPVSSGIWSGLYALPIIDVLTGEASAGNSFGPRLMASGSHRLSHRVISWRIEEGDYVDSSSGSGPSPELNSSEPPAGLSYSSNLVWIPSDQVALLAWPKPLRDWWDSPAGQSWLANS